VGWDAGRTVGRMVADTAIPLRPALVGSAPWRVAAVAFAGYALFLGGLWYAHGIEGFIHFGRAFVTHSDRSRVITPNLQIDNRVGYDGQFYYAIAADPANARYYMKGPGFTYSRIVYPMAARALALGRPAAVPYTLVAINLAAVAMAVFALAIWLRRRRTSTWLALLYALYPGLAFCMYRDLTEPLAFTFAICGAVVFDGRGRHARWAAAALFALAALTRETTVLFPAVYAAASLLEGRGSLGARLRANALRAGAFAAVALLPLLVDRIAFRLWLGSSTVESGPRSIWPFAGLAAWWPWTTTHWLIVLAVVLPALAWTGAATVSLLRDAAAPELWLLLANVLVFVVFLPKPIDVEYGSAARACCGVVAAAILSVPALDRALAGGRRMRPLLLLAWSPLWYAAASIAAIALARS